MKHKPRIRSTRYRFLAALTQSRQINQSSERCGGRQTGRQIETVARTRTLTDPAMWLETMMRERLGMSRRIWTWAEGETSQCWSNEQKQGGRAQTWRGIPLSCGWHSQRSQSDGCDDDDCVRDAVKALASAINPLLPSELNQIRRSLNSNSKITSPSLLQSETRIRFSRRKSDVRHRDSSNALPVIEQQVGVAGSACDERYIQKDGSPARC